nr:MAG TPA: hypothetical protein [Caudoviricetes sp.]
MCALIFSLWYTLSSGKIRLYRVNKRINLERYE